MKQPLVTIISPVYNTGIFVIKALECIKKQTFRDFEHIIIDDCSKDNSVELIEKWIAENNHQCQFIKNETNKGLCGTLNRGIKLAKGKYIKGIGDDEWTDDFLEKRIRHFESLDESIGVTISDTIRIDEESKIIGNSYYAIKRINIKIAIESLVYPTILNRGNFIIAPSAITRKAVFDDVGLYDETLESEDYDMFFRIARKYKFEFYPDPLVLYRERAAGLSRKKFKHHSEKNRHYIDWLSVYSKHLGALNNPEVKQSVRAKYKQMAMYNYLYNKDRRPVWFKNSYRINKDLLSFTFIILSSLQVNPDFILKIKKIFLDRFLQKPAEA